MCAVSQYIRSAACDVTSCEGSTATRTGVTMRYCAAQKGFLFGYGYVEARLYTRLCKEPSLERSGCIRAAVYSSTMTISVDEDEPEHVSY